MEQSKEYLAGHKLREGNRIHKLYSSQIIEFTNSYQKNENCPTDHSLQGHRIDKLGLESHPLLNDKRLYELS
jgi:hypothetical protein